MTVPNTLRRLEQKLDHLHEDVKYLINKENETMGRLDDMNTKIEAFRASQTAENVVIEQVKAAIEALKNAPVGDPDAAAAADAALAAWDDAKSANDAQAAELASAATAALHAKGM